MSIATNRARLPFVVLSSVLVASCATSPTRLGVPDQWRSKQASIPDFVTRSDEKPPMILPATYYSAARLFESRGRYLEARKQYRKAVAVNHTYVEAFHRLGLVHSLLGEREYAVEVLTRAVELAPEDSILRNNLGFEYILSERWEDANDELLAAIRLNPGFARAHINLGIVQSRMQRFDLALASFRTALPEADAHYNLGLMYRGQERYAEATTSFERVLEIDPEFPVAWKQLRQVRRKMARKVKDSKIDVPESDAMRTTTDATSDPAPVDGPVIPDELAGETDLMTVEIGYLMALVDRNLERLAEYESVRVATPVGETIDVPRSHESVESVKNSHSAALGNENDEYEMAMARTPYGEDMPNHAEMSETAGFSYLPEEDIRVAPSATPDLPLFLYASEVTAPLPVIASEPDKIAEMRDPEEDCEEFLLVDMMGDVGPWFSVPAMIPPVSKTADVFSGQPASMGPGESPADAEMIFAIISSFDRNASQPAFSRADPISEKPVPVASINAQTVLRQLEEELAQVREEIYCLESIDEEPAHLTFAMANDRRAPTRVGAPENSSATAEIPDPLHWMLGMRNPALASAVAIPPMLSSPRAEMGPPAPTASFIATNRGANIRPIRARLAASIAVEQRRGKGEVRSFRVTEYEIRETPVAATYKPASPANHFQPAGGAMNPDDMADIDGWIAIVMNELACLEDSARDTPARRND